MLGTRPLCSTRKLTYIGTPGSTNVLAELPILGTKVNNMASRVNDYLQNVAASSDSDNPSEVDMFENYRSHSSIEYVSAPACFSEKPKFAGSPESHPPPPPPPPPPPQSLPSSEQNTSREPQRPAEKTVVLDDTPAVPLPTFRRSASRKWNEKREIPRPRVTGHSQGSTISPSTTMWNKPRPLDPRLRTNEYCWWWRTTHEKPRDPSPNTTTDSSTESSSNDGCTNYPSWCWNCGGKWHISRNWLNRIENRFQLPPCYPRATPLAGTYYRVYPSIISYRLPRPYSLFHPWDPYDSRPFYSPIAHCFGNVPRTRMVSVFGYRL